MRSPRASRSWLVAAGRRACTEPGFGVTLTFQFGGRFGMNPLTTLDCG